MLPIEPITLRGTSGAGGLAVTGTAAAPTALVSAACDGRGAPVNGLLSGPISMECSDPTRS